MKPKTILIVNFAFFILHSACAQFGPSATNSFPLATNTPATAMLLLNRPGNTNLNLAASNALPYLNAVATTPLATRAEATNAATAATNGLAATITAGGLSDVAQYYATAATTVNWTSNNLSCGIVKLASGSASYYITNSAFGTNSLVLVTILDDDGTITGAKALNIATNVVRIKANGNAAANCRLGWKLIAK